MPLDLRATSRRIGATGAAHTRDPARDVAVIVSFKDYAREVVEIASELATRGVPLIVITDNPLGPFARLAKVSFEVGEAKNRPFRSLVAPICLAQSLVVGLGHRLAERQGAKNGRRR